MILADYSRRRQGCRLLRLTLAAGAMVACGLLGSGGALQGKPAPDVLLEDGKGGALRISGAPGTVLVLSFWATWCGPCRQELPELERLRRDLGAKVRILVVSDEAFDVTGAYLRRENLQLENLRDGNGYAHRAYGVSGIPALYVIDKEGIVRHVHQGYSDGEYDVLKREVEELAGG